MAYIAGRQHMYVEFERNFPEEQVVESILCNTTMSAMYHQLGREVSVVLMIFDSFQFVTATLKDLLIT